MEKTISVEERIKRAEEIYSRRLGNSEYSKYTYKNLKENKPKKIKYTSIKKMTFQIVICLIIYAFFYTISNREYVFTEDFRNNVSHILNTEFDFNKIYNEGKAFFFDFLYTKTEETVENITYDKDDTKLENDEINDENKTNEVNDDSEVNQEQSSIGGAAEENTENNQEDSNESGQLEKSQMEIDAEEIKKAIDFEVPVEGRISSTFGLRNPTTSTVPKNHTGLDIAATTGTVIKSATDGTITLASSYGDYGMHYKIEIGDVILVYAHCSKLYLKEGDTVTKGQSIAEVGSTGNSTGPHLHFEIRKDGRYVDPQLILDI